MPDPFYGTANGFKLYHQERGNVVDLDLDDTEIEVCLLVGSEWMDAQYSSHLTGEKILGRDVVREQPRTGQTDIYGNAIPSDEVPREFIYSTYEIALKHLNQPGVLNADYTPGKYKSATVSGAVSVVYRTFSQVSEIQTHFAKVGQLMMTLVSSSSKSSSLSGGNQRV